MSYDPSRDEPRYTRRELEEEVLRYAEKGFLRGIEQAFRFLSEQPLRVLGRWEPDTVYAPHDLVTHGGARWLAMAATSGEPGKRDGWLRLPAAADTTPPRAA